MRKTFHYCDACGKDISATPTPPEGRTVERYMVGKSWTFAVEVCVKSWSGGTIDICKGCAEWLVSQAMKERPAR